MVNIIEENRRPSFSEQLLSGLSRAAQEGAVSIPQFIGNQRNQKSQNEELDKRFGEGFSKLPPEIQKITAKEMAKNLVGQKTEENEGVRQSLDWLEDNIKYTGSTMIPFTSSFGADAPGTWNREGKEKRAEFDSTGFWATDNIYTHFNKGQISEAKLELIKKELAPNSKLSERENKARIAGLRRIANLPRNAPASIVNKKIDNEINASRKISKAQGLKLTDEIIDKILDEANQDPIEAERIAKERGYKW